MRHAARFTIIAALVVSGTFGSAAAAPSSDKQRAAQSFQIGKAAYARGDFSAAAAAFEQAALYAPHPATLLNAAESWELAENPARAAQLYDRVLDASVLEAQHQQVAAKQLTKLEKKIGTLTIKAPPKARIDVDEREESATKIRVAPGAHKLKMTSSDGETRTQSIVVGAGETKDVDFLTKPEPEPVTPPAQEKRPPPPDRPPASSGPPLATWISFGVAVAAGGLGAYYGVKTLDAKGAFDARPTLASRDDFNSSRLFTNVAIGVAVATAAVGIVVWLVSGPERRPPKVGTILPWQAGLLW